MRRLQIAEFLMFDKLIKLSLENRLIVLIAALPKASVSSPLAAIKFASLSTSVPVEHGHEH